MVSLPCEGRGIYVMIRRAVFFVLSPFRAKLKLRVQEIVLRHAVSFWKVWNHELSKGGTW